MPLFYADSIFLDHCTGPGHPERPERVARTLAHLDAAGLLVQLTRAPFAPLAESAILGVHSHEHVQKVRALAEQGGGNIDPDTVVSPRSYEAACAAAGAAVAASDAVITGTDSRAFCLVRPPGHHATRSTPMGFCLFNNVALAAVHALTRHELGRILIVDWDVHHGNGTEEIFYADPRVMFFSIHRSPFYPGTGARGDTGTGPGLGFTRNEPIAFGTPRSEYLARFRAALGDVADKIRPELVLISAGFDAHAADPIGSLGLEIEDFVAMSESVLDVARVHAAGRVVGLLEGGYNLTMLAGSVEAHLNVLLEHP